jgi:twitching motility two-component system response regulator PilH
LARKILLADDSVTAQNMGRKILADAGYEVITVNNGSAALKKIAEQKPDLIVLDVYMPGYSGLEVCQRLKEANETSRIPVLLTVGKLEPFKPEEAKRARADAFIVKPFEASELLSALSKLEDKIVPRPEASKPGRFARVTAALEEGRYDKTVAIEEDVGWKDRISFPSKKKEKSVPEDGDSAAIYTAPEGGRKPAEKRRAKAEETWVDLGALAPEGLPKDVTPEEIAALAAAAAQVKGKIADSSFAEPAEAESAQAKIEEKDQTQPALPVPQEVTAATPAATFAEQRPEQAFVEKIEEKFEATSNDDKSSEAAGTVAPSPSDVIAALAGLNADADPSRGATSETGLSAHSPIEPAENEPVTMAVAARTESGGEAPRWKAVSVALDPDEATISLEHEMQKAYAAFAAAENGHAPSLPAVSELGPVDAAPASASSFSSTPENAPAEPVVPIPAMTAPEAAQTLSALANASTDALRAAVQELEMVAESYRGQPSPPPVIEPASAAEAHQTLEAVAKEAEAAEQPRQEAAKVETAKPHESDSQRDDRQHDDRQPVDQQSVDRQNVDQQNYDWRNKDRQHETVNQEQPSLAAVSTSPTFINELPAERTSAHQDSSHPEAAAAEGNGKMGDKESDPATATAAAWASWRRIRESGDPKAASEAASQQPEGSAPQDAAAMAVAAGAEKAPEEAFAESESDPAAIASIVDSVLADLRPKIFEEISRKMGKKK